MKKILVSHGFGAGWSTWNSGEIGEYMLTYQPVIDFLESGGKFTETDIGGYNSKKLHPVLQQLADDCKEKFGVEYVCMLGADSGLRVETVYGPFKIYEYDGSESIQYRDEQDWIDA